MRQVGMEIERVNPLEEVKLVQVFVDCERRNLSCAFDDGRSKSELIYHRYPKCLHHRTGVLSEALLARDESISVVGIFQLALLQIFSKTHIVMGPKQKASSFTFQPLADGFDLPRRRLLLRNQVIEPEYHERV